MGSCSEWIDVKDRLPEDDGNLVLCLVTGAYGNVGFCKALCLGFWTKDEGWILENWPRWENPGVTHWMSAPDIPEDVQT